MRCVRTLFQGAHYSETHIILSFSSIYSCGLGAFEERYLSRTFSSLTSVRIEPEKATSGIRILQVTISSDRNKFVDRRIATKKLRNMPHVK